MGPDPDHGHKHRGPASLVAAAAFGLAVVVMLVWLLAMPASPPAPPGHAASRHATATTPSTLPPPAAATSSDAAPALVEDQAPTGVQWRLYQGVALPFSRANGPGTVNGDVAAGYAHNPEGALLAATQIGVRYLVAPDWQAVTAASVAPGPGRASLGTPTPGTYLQIAGYQFVTYTPQTAVVQLVSQASSGAYQVVTNTVAWSGGDWKLVLQANGSSSPTAQVVSSVAGFIVWGGV